MQATWIQMSAHLKIQLLLLIRAAKKASAQTNRCMGFCCISLTVANDYLERSWYGQIHRCSAKFCKQNPVISTGIVTMKNDALMEVKVTHQFIT